MKKQLLILGVILYLFSGAEIVSATLLTANSAVSSQTISLWGRTYNDVNNVAKAIDGEIPSEYTRWTTDTAWWSTGNPTSEYITIDYGELFTIEDIILSVDNNDAYRVDFSTDNSSWTQLFAFEENVSEDVTWGMDTISTIAGDQEYVAALDFNPVQAQYFKIYATGGDRSYSVGEFSAYGTASGAAPVPEPATMLLAGIGLIGIAGSRLRKNKQ